MSMHNVKTVVETITPEVARAYLAANTDNRRLRKSAVDRWALAMKRGEWVLSGDPIAFSCHGRLLNGQHRLHAIVASGVSASFAVMRGLPEEAFAAFDRGVKRTFEDVIKVNREISEVARAAIVISRGIGVSYTDGEVAAVAKTIAPYHEKIILASNSRSRVFSAAAMRLAGTLHIIFSKDNSYCIETYRLLTLLTRNPEHFEHLSPLPRRFAANVLTGKWRSDGRGGDLQKDLLKHGWCVFDAARQHATRFTPKMLECSWLEVKSHLNMVCETSGVKGVN